MTNVPFTVSVPQVMLLIPEDRAVRVMISVDGNDYEDVFGWMYGRQHAIISSIPCNLYMKIESLENFEINILR